MSLSKLVPKFVAQYAPTVVGAEVTPGFALGRYIIDHDLADIVHVILSPEMWSSYEELARQDPEYRTPEFLIFDGFTPELEEGSLPARLVVLTVTTGPEGFVQQGLERLPEPTHLPPTTLQ